MNDADELFNDETYNFEQVLAAGEIKAAPPEDAPVPAWKKDDGDDQEIGAIGFMDDAEDLVPDGDELLPVDENRYPTSQEEASSPAVSEGSAAVNDVLEEFNGPSEAKAPAKKGRTQKYTYTSLPEAVAALGNWSEFEGHDQFGKALGNLLFSHGLAHDSLLLTVRDGVLIDSNGDWAIDVDGDLAQQAAEIAAPMTMLDIHMQNLTDRESSLLEEVTPDMILPLMRGDKLSALLLLNRGGEESEYSVAEHFALELLMRILVENQGRNEETLPVDHRPTTMHGGLRRSGAAGDDDLRATLAVGRDDSMAETLLELALNLPDADDGPHFWRLFLRHVWDVLPIKNLSFLAPKLHRAQIIAGDSDKWQGIHLGDDKLQHFFRSLERPMEVANLPTFFKGVKTPLARTGAQWIVSLNWDDEFLGTVFVSIDESCESENPQEFLEEILTETSRLLSRFDDSNDIADVNMNLLRLLISQREMRCHGSGDLTKHMCDELHRLANVMGFPPEQERNLIYGCLLRDVGLVASEDALMGSPTEMDPTQWPVYRSHPSTGVNLLADLNLPQTIMDVVRCHHERFNGEGFPLGLAGRKIPLAARLVTVVENFVAMTLGVAGRQPLTEEEAAKVLRDNLGDRYDPDIVSLFLKAKDSDGELARELAEETETVPSWMT